jgi:hypothetical protein
MYNYICMFHQNDIPDVALSNILSYITPQSFLPICHVSKRFRLVWIEMHTNNGHMNDNTTRTHTHTGTHTSTIGYETNPLSIGNLFESSWFFNNYDNNSNNGLNTTLLTYYIQNGFGSLVLKNYHTIHNNDNNDSNNNDNSNNNNINVNNDDAERGKKMLKKVMLQTASRGDIHGMNYMFINGYFPLNDEEICTTAGAAGKLEALKWLRGEGQVQCEGQGKVTTNKDMNCGDNKNKICCPWNPTEVHREAAENSHEDIMDYVEKNCKNHEIQMHYGVGLPW